MTPPVRLAVRLLEGHDPELPLPQHETEGAAGLDLRACLAPLDRAHGLALDPMQRALIPTGLAIAIPAGFEGQIRPRSGLAARHGITLLNSPGTLDADYRGEVQVLLVNLGTEPHRIAHGDRIAQLVIAPCARAELNVVAALDPTARGAGGFGSTGTG